MRFVNHNKWPLDFSIDGQTFKVPVGGDCEIPDELAHVVKERGILLTEEEATASTPTEFAEPTRAHPSVVTETKAHERDTERGARTRR